MSVSELVVAAIFTFTLRSATYTLHDPSKVVRTSCYRSYCTYLKSSVLSLTFEGQLPRNMIQWA
jgi:hypothetical protein